VYRLEVQAADERNLEVLFLITYRHNDEVKPAGIYNNIELAESACYKMKAEGYQFVGWEPWPLNEIYNLIEPREDY